MPFIKHPVNSFAMGTWIAGVSVLCNVFLEYFPSIIRLIQVVALFNSLLWILFFLMCFYNFKKLSFATHECSVHGILLLSTVGTQSIVILLNNVFIQLPVVFSEAVIFIGLVFYIVGVLLITRWFATNRNWSIADDWSNTNCIIHGALSITGLAIVTTNTFTPFIINLLWIIIFILLLFIESIELFRARKRIQKYGWHKGLFSYHVTQWSRNFTFGMFYVFTLMLHKNTTYFLSKHLISLQTSILGIWAWIVSIALITEIIIFLKHYIIPTSFSDKTSA